MGSAVRRSASAPLRRTVVQCWRPVRRRRPPVRSDGTLRGWWRSAGLCRCCSPIWWGSRRRPSVVTRRTRASFSRAISTLCRRLIELYGGSVEKFIGDAVVGVWGAPVATEDDAERAVRAALELVAAVQALGEEVGDPELRARAGVLSGEAAVTLGARVEAMVAGDLVNTASRVQSVAPPGGVLVGEATRRATEQTVVYESAGNFELKGKSGLVPALAGAAGRLRDGGRAQGRGARGAVRRPRPGAALAQGAVSRLRRGEQGVPGVGDGHRRDRQVAAGVGVLQVHRRAAADHAMAPWSLPGLWRGRDLLGAGGHGADALPDRRGRGAGLGACQAAGDA